MKIRRIVAFLTLAPLLVPILLRAKEPVPLAGELRSYVERSELAGAVAMVVNRKSTLSTDVVGFSDIESGKEMSADDIFWIASQSKPMTAVAVMMLVDEGKLSLDDPIEKYLPEFRGQMVIAEKDDDHILLKKPVHPVTLRETLSHMSGLPFKSAAEEPVLDSLPLAAAVRTYAMTPLQTEPGTAYQYSNAGINTAARVLEVVSGMPYETFMQERLFTPLGMKDTTFWPDEAQSKRIARSYRPNAEKNGLDPFTITQLTYPLSGRTNRFPMPAGGLFSTAADTARFCQMLLNRGELDGKLYLSESSVAEISKRQTPESVKNAYGLGFAVGPDWFGHGGAHATNMEIHPKEGVALIWMVQHGGFPGEGAKAQGRFKEEALARFPRSE